MKLSHHKRVISLFLAFLMVFSLTTPLFAVETPEIPTAMPEESVTNESDQVQNNQEPEGSQETLPTQSGTTEEADENNQQTNPEGEVADTFSLKIFGRGITSSNTEEQIKAGTEVVLTINVPEQQRLFSFDVNDEEKKDALVLQEDGSLTYTFTMEKDTVVKVYYETLPTVPVGDKKVHFSFEFIDPLNKRLVGVPTDWSINQEFIPRFNQSFILRDEYGNEYKPDETEEPAETTAMTFSNLATGEYYLEYTPPYDEAFFTPYRYLWNGRVYRVHRLTSIYVDKDENSLVLRMKANIPLVSEEKEIYVPTPNPNASSNTNINRIVEALPKTWTLRDPLFPEREYQARVNWRFSTFDLRKLSLNKEVMIRGRIFEDSSDPWERFYTSDRTIYVVVKTEDILPVKVTFDHNYEGAPEAIVLQPNGEGIVTPPADPVREGYTFLGWFFDQGGYGEPIDFSYALFTEDTTVYAKWEEIPPVEVTFNQNYEGAPEATTVEADKEGKVTPPEAPVREDYSFKGWFVNAEGTGEAVDFETATFTENTTLYAKWTKINYENVQVRFFKDAVLNNSYWVSETVAKEFMPKFFIVNTETGVRYTPTEGSYNQSMGMAVIKNVPEGNYSMEFVPGDPFHVDGFYQYDKTSYGFKPTQPNGNFRVVKGEEPIIAPMVISSIKLVKILPQDPEEYEVEVANDYTEANALIQKLKNEVLPKTVKLQLSNGETVEASLAVAGFNLRPNELTTLGKHAVYSWFVLPDKVSKGNKEQRLETKVVLHVVPKKPPVGHLEPTYFTMWHGSSLNILTPEDFAPGDFYLESVETGKQYNWKEGELVPHYDSIFNTKKILKLEVPVGEYKVVFVPRADRVLVGAFEDQNNYKPFDIEKQNFTVHYNPAPTLKKNYLDFVNRAKDSYTLTLEGENISSVPAAGKVFEQTEVKVTVAPEAGYKVSSFTVNNEDKLAELVDNVYTFTINKDTTVKVEYEKIPEMWHKISFVAGEHGTLEGTVEFTDILNGTPWKDAGITVPTPKADEGYKFKGWSPELPGDDSVIDKDIAYTAIFEEVLKKDVSLEFYKDKLNTDLFYRFSKASSKLFAEQLVIVNTETKEEYKADLDSITDKGKGLIKGVPEGTYEIKFTAPEPFTLITYAETGGYNPKAFEGNLFVVTTKNNAGIGVALRSSIQLKEILTPDPYEYPVVKAANTSEANQLAKILKSQYLPKLAKIEATDNKVYECELVRGGFDIRAFLLVSVGKRSVKSFFKLPDVVSELEDGSRTVIEVKLDVREKPATITFEENYDGAPTAKEVVTDNFFRFIAPTDPIREGYIFKGWFRDAEGTGEAVDFETATFTENTTLYAKWERKPTATLNFSFSFIHNNDNSRAVGIPEHWSANSNFVSDFNKSFKLKDAQGNLHEPTSISEDKTSLVFEGLAPGKYTTVYTAPYGNTIFKPYAWMFNGYSEGAYNASQAINIWKTDSPNTLELELKCLVPLLPKEDETIYEIPAYDPTLSDAVNTENVKAALPKEWTVYDEQFPEKTFIGYTGYYFSRQLKDFKPGTEHDINASVYEYRENPWERVYNHHGVDFKIKVKVPELPAKVTFDQNYEGAPEATTVEADKEGKVTPPANPTREKYDFKGWYADAEGSGEAIDFTTATFKEDTTVYAKWSKRIEISVATNEFGKLKKVNEDKIAVNEGSSFVDIKEELQALVMPVHSTAAVLSHWEKDGVEVSDDALVKDGDQFTAIFRAAEGYREIRFEEHYDMWKKLSLSPTGFAWTSTAKDVEIDGKKVSVLYGLAKEGQYPNIRGSKFDTRVDIYYQLNETEPKVIKPQYNTYVDFYFGKDGNQVGRVAYKEVPASVYVRLNIGHKTETGVSTDIFNAKRLGEENLTKFYLQRMEDGQAVGEKRFFNLEVDRYDTSNEVALHFQNIKMGEYILGYDLPEPWIVIAESAGGMAKFEEPHQPFVIDNKSVTRWVVVNGQLNLREVEDPQYYLGVGVNGHEAQAFINDPSQKLKNNLTGREMFPVKVKAYDGPLGVQGESAEWVERLVGRNQLSMNMYHWDSSGTLDAVKTSPTDPEKPLSFRHQYYRTAVLEPSEDLRPLGSSGYGGNTLHIDIKLSILEIPTLKFAGNGGMFEDETELKEVKTDKYLKAEAPAAPVKKGATFLGWFDEEGQEFDGTRQYLKDTSFTAKWEEKDPVDQMFDDLGIDDDWFERMRRFFN